MKLMVDARYTRIGFHDGISRYTASLLGALKDLMDSGAPEVADLQLVMVISDERQLQMLPDLPHVKICSPTGPLEPTAALQLNKYKPDVVFSPMQTIGSVGRKFKLVLTLHDLIYYAHPTPPGFLPAPVRAGWRLFHKSYTPQRMLLNRADAVVTVSESTARLIREHQLTEKPLHVVPNAPQPGSVVSEDEALRRARSRTEGASRHLVYMGSFMPYKNVETLLYAMRELPGYTLHLLSKMPDARRAELEEQGLLSPLAASSNVVVHNGVSDEEYAELLESAHALVTASRAEGYGLPVVEAQAAGCPAVISDIDIFREIAPHAVFAPVTEDPQADAPAWVEVIRYLEDETVRDRVILEGLQDASHYSWRDSALKLVRVVDGTTIL